MYDRLYREIYALLKEYYFGHLESAKYFGYDRLHSEKSQLRNVDLPALKNLYQNHGETSMKLDNW